MLAIKLKKFNVSTRFAHFPTLPSWRDLAAAIFEIFQIPVEDVGVAFVDKDNGAITLANEKDLQKFYNRLPEEIEFVVQNLRNPDSPAITSTRSPHSNLSDLSKTGDKVSLCFWVLNAPDNPCLVNIEREETINRLKKKITEEKKHEFSGIDYTALQLWKISPSIPSSEFAMKLERVQSPEEVPGCTKLECVDQVLEHFSSPLRKHIHLVVQSPLHSGYNEAIGRPETRQRPNIGVRHGIITPSAQVLEIDAVRSEIEGVLTSISPQIQSFLQNPELPEWQPPSSIMDVEFLRKLRIPAYRDGRPSLLFHNLHSGDGGLSKKICGANSHFFICNTSGSGKTRLILEGLGLFWGFYFVAALDGNGVGVSDLEEALDDIGCYEEWEGDLTKVDPESRERTNKTNIHITRRAVRKVLAARVVVFKAFLQLAIANDGELRPEHKRIWLLFQLSNYLPGSKTFHPFLQVKHCLDRASDEALESLIADLERIHSDLLPTSKIIFALDEAQRATQLYRYPFLSSSTPNKYRSIVREIVNVFLRSSVKVIVSGTGLSVEEVEDPSIYSAGKPPRQFKTFVDFGMFNNPQQMETILHQFIPPSFFESESGKHLQHRIREYLPCRYRFLTAFVELLLANGLASPHSLLNVYVEKYASFSPGDRFTSKSESLIIREPPLQIDLTLRGFDWERLRENPKDIAEVAQIVQSHLTQSSSPTYGSLASKHIEYGIARLRQDHKCQIIEPLAFLSIVKWFETQDDICLDKNLRHQLTHQRSRGYGYEELVILYLVRTFSQPTVLSLVFDFHGTVPSWANVKTQIVGRLGGHEVPVDIIGDVPMNPSLAVVCYAESIEEVIQWIEGPSGSSILVVSDLFGPDIIIRCQGVLLVGHAKSYLEGNKEEIAKALTSLTPEHWFEQKPNLEERQKLIDTLNKYHVLRFIAGYPLPPKLGLKASSVKVALSKLGQVALATLDLDEFRAKFISPGEASNVLEPMEDALARKRKRGLSSSEFSRKRQRKSRRVN